MVRLALAIVFMSCTNSGAQTLAEKMFSGNSSGCYKREYSSGHMQQFPVQQVRAVALWPDPGVAGSEGLALRLDVWTRGAALPAKARAYCRDGRERLACTLDEDQGVFTLDPMPNGALLLAPATQGVALRVGTGYIVMRRNAGNDRAFLLPPVPPQFCDATR